MTPKMTGPAAELTAATAHLRVYEPLACFVVWAQAKFVRPPQRTAALWAGFEN